MTDARTTGRATEKAAARRARAAHPPAQDDAQQPGPRQNRGFGVGPAVKGIWIRRPTEGARRTEQRLINRRDARDRQRHAAVDRHHSELTAEEVAIEGQRALRQGR